MHCSVYAHLLLASGHVYSYWITGRPLIHWIWLPSPKSNRWPKIRWKKCGCMEIRWTAKFWLPPKIAAAIASPARS